MELPNGLPAYLRLAWNFVIIRRYDVYRRVNQFSNLSSDLIAFVMGIYIWQPWLYSSPQSRNQWGILAGSLDHNKPPPSLILKIELISFAVITRYPVVKYVLVKVLYIFRVVSKSFHPHKLPENRIFFNLCVKQTTSVTQLLTRMVCWTQILKK